MVRRGVHTKAWSSKASQQTGRQTHTFSKLEPSKQANTSAAAQRSSVQSPPTPVGNGRPSYACMRPASQCPLACYVLYRPMQTGLGSGATFYNGNSRPYSAAHFAQTPNFLSPASATRNFRPVPRRGRLGKGKSVAKFVAVGCVWSVCVRVSAARPRFAEKLIARRALLWVERVTSPRLLHMRRLI